MPDIFYQFVHVFMFLKPRFFALLFMWQNSSLGGKGRRRKWEKEGGKETEEAKLQMTFQFLNSPGGTKVDEQSA